MVTSQNSLASLLVRYPADLYIPIIPIRVAHTDVQVFDHAMPCSHLVHNHDISMHCSQQAACAQMYQLQHGFDNSCTFRLEARHMS